MAKGLPDGTHLIWSYYECPCGNAWESTWDSACDDDCGECGATISPSTSQDVPECDCADCVANDLTETI